MKVILYLLIALLPFCFSSVSQAAGDDGIVFQDLTFDQAVKKAKSENKIVFIDCYTVWCGPCKYMSNVVFKDADVAKYFNENFINVKYDMEKGEGPALSGKLEVKVFPTFVFVDGEGKVIHRIAGSSDPSSFLTKAKEGTGAKSLVKMQERYRKGDRDTRFLVDYIGVLGDAYLSDEAGVVAREFIGGREAEMLGNEDYFNIFVRYVEDPNSGTFRYVLNHKDDFSGRYTPELVEQKIYDVWSSYPKIFVKKSGDNYKLDEKGLKAYMTQMKDAGVKECAQIETLTRMYGDEMTGNWNSYVKRGTAVLNSMIAGNSVMELYNWGRTVNRKCEDLKIRANAAKWYDKVLADIKEKKTTKSGDDLTFLNDAEKAFTKMQERLRQPMEKE